MFRILPRAAAVPSSSFDRRSAGPTGIRTLLSEEVTWLRAHGLTRKPGNVSYARLHWLGARGVVVMLHGFGGGTAEWRHLTHRVFARGYDVLVPSLPGHGQLDGRGKEDLRALPTTKTFGDYGKFGDRLMDAVKGYSRVHLFGFSTGAAVALGMAQQHRNQTNANGQPLIRSVGGVSTFLRPAGRLGAVGDWVKLAEEKSDGLAGRWMDQMPAFSKPVKDFGMARKTVGSLYAATAFAEGISQNAASLRGLPVRLIASEADKVACPREAEAFARHAGGSFHQFGVHRGLRHGMVSPVENKDARSVDEIAELLMRDLG